MTKSLDNKNCVYAVAGASKMYIANWYPMIEATVAPAEPPENSIVYVKDTDGNITDIILPDGEAFYAVNGSANTISWSDALLAGGNGGKFRQHTLNAVLNQYDQDVLDEGDALSLGTFIAVVVNKSGRLVALGRTGGLSAPAGGMDYNSGAAEADAVGWTMIQQGTSTEIAPIVKDITALTIAPEPVVVP